MPTYTLTDIIEIGGEEYEVEVEGFASLATPDTVNWDYPNGLPGDPAESEVEHVWVSLPVGEYDKLKKAYIEVKFDFVNIISENLLELFAEKLLQLAENEDGQLDDRDYDEEA
jgi:hypothetical protein